MKVYLILFALLLVSGCRGTMTVIEYGEPTATPIPSITPSPTPR